MLQAHSFLWHYLWLAPHMLQVALAVVMWRRGLHRTFPFFFTYIVFEAIEEFSLYAIDVLPFFSAETFWQSFRVSLVMEGLVKFAVIGELFLHLLRPWPAVAKMGNRLITGAGVVLVMVAALAAAYAPIDNPEFAIISRAHVLEQTLYIILCGLVLFLFSFAAYFHLAWNNRVFGIALGFGILSCEHLAAWAIVASGAVPDKRHVFDFVNLATYHACVLVWAYYLLIPQRAVTRVAVALPDHNLEIWNRELERLLQQ